MTLQVLILEDRPEDAELMLFELRKAGFEVQGRRVDTEADFQAHLKTHPDIILADYSLPQYDARRALGCLKKLGLDVPCIIVTGALNDEEAVACLKEGAADYVRKDRLVRLGHAVSAALERKEIQKRLMASEKMAAIGRFAAGASHELNNPLACVIGFSEVALSLLTDRRVNRTKLKTTLNKITHHAGRCRGIVTSLLAYGRAFSLEPAALLVDEVIEDALTRVGRQIPLDHITLIKHYAPELPDIQANREALTRVFINLVINACQAMDGRGTLTITTRPSHPDVEIEFRDTGRGIAAEHLPKLFDPFFSTREVGEGAGLGLSICAGIIQAYQGEIKAESRGAGQGAIFTVRLPFSQKGGPHVAKETGATSRDDPGH